MMKPTKQTDRTIRSLAKKGPIVQEYEPPMTRAQDTLDWMRKRRIYRGIRDIPYLTPEEIKSAGFQ